MRPGGPHARDTDTAGVTLRVLDSTVRVLVPAAYRERFRELWSRCLADELAATGDELDLREADLALGAHNAEYAAVSRVTMHALASVMGERINFHAAGLERDGEVIVLVGPSGRGKTTAARNLARDLGYVSDECVSIDPSDGSVLPFPKPLSLVRGNGGQAKSQHAPDELGLLPVTGPLRVRRIVVLDRLPDLHPDAAVADLDPRAADLPDPESLPAVAPLDSFEAILDLVANTSALPQLDAPLTQLHGLLERTGGAVGLTYQHPEQLAEAVEQLLRPPSDAPVLDAVIPPAARQLLPPPSHRATAADLPQPPQGEDAVVPDVLQRTPWTEALVREESAGQQVLLMRGADVAVLGGVGAALWLAAENPIARADLFDSVVTTVGFHPDSEQILADATLSLVAAGALGSG